MKNDTPIYIFNYIKKLDYFPNAYIIYRIMLTIHVTVVSTEISFSKLIKSYLRSINSQQRLNEMNLLLIEKKY